MNDFKILKILWPVTQCICARSWESPRFVDLLLLQVRGQCQPGEYTPTTVQSQLGQPLPRSVNATYEGGRQVREPEKDFDVLFWCPFRRWGLINRSRVAEPGFDLGSKACVFDDCYPVCHLTYSGYSRLPSALFPLNSHFLKSIPHDITICQVCYYLLPVW